MSKIVKNISGSNKNYGGQLLSPNQEYTILDSELKTFQSSSLLITDLTSSTPEAALIIEGLQITGSDAVIELLNNGIKLTKNTAFADKAQLFFRGSGKKVNCLSGQTTNIIFEIPHTKARLNGMEILYGQDGDTCNFKVLDSTTGSYTTVPNYLLNQFGFDWNITKEPMSELLPYDADVFYGMQLVVEYTNNGTEDVEVGVNFYVHEDKS